MSIFYYEARSCIAEHQDVICYHKLFDSFKKAVNAALSLGAKGDVTRVLVSVMSFLIFVVLTTH